MERSQDDLCYVRNFGSPYSFITVPCSLTWNDMKMKVYFDQRSCSGYDTDKNEKSEGIINYW